MNTISNNTSSNASDDAGRDTAASRAERGTTGWEDAARLQRWATPDHGDFYALAGEIVSTLYALDDVGQVLVRQVADYADTQQARGRQLYDDTRQVRPLARLVTAVEALADTRDALAVATRSAHEFWSAIGHIGTEDLTGTDDIPDTPAAGPSGAAGPAGAAGPPDPTDPPVPTDPAAPSGAGGAG